MNLQLFRHQPFRRFVIGQGTAVFGNLFLSLALSLYLLDMTGSAAQFASTLAAGVLPNLLFGLFAGVIVDRLPKKRLLLSLDLIRGVLLFVYFLVSCLAPLPQVSIYLLVLTLGLCELFFLPAFVTVLPNLVTPKELLDANALQSTAMETLRMLAPVLAALTYHHWELSVILLVNSLTFFVSAYAIKGISFPTKPIKRAHAKLLQEFGQTITLFRNEIRLRSLVINGLLTHFFLTAMFLVGFPYLIKEVFSGSDVQVGLVESLATIGTVTSVLLVALFRRRNLTVSQGIWYGIIGMNLTAMPLLLLGSSQMQSWLHGHLVASTCFFGAVAFLMYWTRGAYGVFFVSYYQQNVSSEIMGRFFSVMSLCFALGRAGGLYLYGWLFDRGTILLPLLALLFGMVLKLLVHIPFLRAERFSKNEFDNSNNLRL